ncbi:MAG TPA: signal peptidase I [Verrucomicrobiae bacterium]|jgi:signal peptidase I
MAETSSGTGKAGLFQILTVGRNPKRTLVRAAALAVICLVVFKFVLLPVRVEGISMEPTYADHSVNAVNCVAYLWHPPRRGDVVGIRLTPPSSAALSSPHIMYLKRIIGLPGETISFKHGHPYVNDELLEEPYEKQACHWNMAPVTLGADEYFFVGDNRTMPKEYHTFGKAPRDRIVGKALW